MIELSDEPKTAEALVRIARLFLPALVGILEEECDLDPDDTAINIKLRGERIAKYTLRRFLADLEACEVQP